MRATFDTNHMTIAQMDDLIKELRKTRQRKESARARAQQLIAMIEIMETDEKLIFRNKFTGERLNPYEWTIYDISGIPINYDEAE